MAQPIADDWQSHQTPEVDCQQQTVFVRLGLSIFHNPPVFEIQMLTEIDPVKARSNLSGSKSSGMDGITSYMIQTRRQEIRYLLLFFLNGKRQKLRPTSEPGNYQSISILPTMGKLLKQQVHWQCSAYLERTTIYVPGSQVSEVGGLLHGHKLNSIAP